MFPWLLFLPSAKGSRGANRPSGTLSLKPVTYQVPQISPAFSQFLWQTAQVLLSLEFFWRKQGKGQLGFLASVTTWKHCHYLCFLHWIWQLFKLQQPDLIFAQFKLGCFCHSFYYHNMGSKWDLRRKGHASLYSATFSFLWEVLCSLSQSSENLSILVQETRAKTSRKYVSISATALPAILFPH